MSGRFAGWPEQAFDVLLRLDGTPTREARESMRSDRENLVRQPMIALLDDVADADAAYGDFSVSGFAKEIWWWQHQGAVVRLAENLEFGLRFDLDGLYLKANWHHPGADQLRLYRAAVAAPATGRQLAGVLASLSECGYQISADVMTRMPRGYPAGHERSGLLRCRTLGAGRMLGHDDTLRTPEAIDLVLTAARELALPWDQPRRRREGHDAARPENRWRLRGPGPGGGQRVRLPGGAGPTVRDPGREADLRRPHHRDPVTCGVPQLDAGRDQRRRVGGVTAG